MRAGLIDAGIVATTAMHGANAPVDKTDWSPLSGKAVLIWPDRDKPGWEYATQAAQAILSAGAKSCHILYPPEEAAEGWDAADAIAEGFDVATFLTHGPRLQMHDVADDVDPVVSSDESVWGTEDALALAFTRRYHRDWRYVAAGGDGWCGTGNAGAPRTRWPPPT
jgi:putative DNA primase/helicase